MKGRLLLQRGWWTVADQAVVSGGAFLLNVVLARYLSPAEYGTFAVLFGGMLTLQLFNATLLIHPLSVCLATAAEVRRKQIVQATLVLGALLSVGLTLVLGAGILVIGRGDLLVSASLAFLAWQIQETLRRGLLTVFRHRDAAAGDAVSYIGQAILAVAMAWQGTITLSTAFYVMAATSVPAALIQAWQLGLPRRAPLELGRTAREYWGLGGFWSLGNGLLSQLRVQVVPWTLAAVVGPAAAAGFQAAANVVNLANPIMISLGNIIPQTAAQARLGGTSKAWEASKAYAWMAVPPILGYAVVLLAVPGLCLSLLYGAGSDYARLELPVRLLLTAALLGYATDVVIAFLHGVAAVPSAFRVNLASGLATAVFVLPFVHAWGLVGGCLAVIIANVVRLVMGHLMLSRIMASASHGGQVRQMAGEEKML